MKEQKILSYIGISRKAGFCTVGTELTADGIRSCRVRLAVLASDASENTKKRITNACAYHKIPLITALDSERLGKISGRSAPISAVGITDKGLCEAIEKAAASE